MLVWVTVFLGLQLLGEVLVGVTGLPLPGPVVGMALLFLGLTVAGEARVPDGLEATARGLLGHLSLLFVPAGVGVLVHLAVLRDQGLAIALALVGSTLITVAVTAWVMAALSPRDLPAEDGAGDDR